MPIPDKTKWQGHKKQFGIPDGVSRVKMGDSFALFAAAEKKFRSEKDYEGCAGEVDKLIRALTQYEADLAKTNPDKFTGANVGEKHKRREAAIKLIKDILAEATKLKATYLKLARPLEGVKEALKKAEEKFKTLKSNSAQTDFSTFYSEQYRGINLPLKQLEAMALDSQLKSLINSFKAHANVVNQEMNKSPFNGGKVYSVISQSLTLLSNALG